jgi:fluoroacetyl-CoA thioesterase
MKDSLAAGIRKTIRFTIDLERTIDFMGDEARVYATPELVRDIENTCRNLLLEHLEQDEDSVGTHIDLDHLAPTLLNMWVEITAILTELKGRQATFEVTAKDNLEDVAHGRHVRFIVDVNVSAERFKRKAEKVYAS